MPQSAEGDRLLSIPAIEIRSMGEHTGAVVRLRGWVYQSRSSGKVAFLVLRDGSGMAQVVLSKADLPEETFEAARQVTQESSVIVTGEVRKDDRAPGGYEISARSFDLFHLAEEYPITPKSHGLPFLMDHRHLWLRSRRPHAILTIRSSLIHSLRSFFEREDFVLVDAPIFTPSSCEGTSTLFETEYFGRSAYLSQSGQLYMEAAAAAFGKVYCFGPTFRAEKSKTRRHLTEFWMLEPEVAWATMEDAMQLAERMVTSVVGEMLEKHKAELDLLERDTAPLEAVKAPFPRVHYDEAIELLHREGKDTSWGDDFGGDEETVISASFDKPIFIHRFPKGVKAFYMAEDPADPRVVLGMDMIAPEGYGEIIGGGERTHSLEHLDQQIARHELPPGPLSWYRDLRRYGSFPHAGFGLGLERLVAWICGVHHVRETSPFPRTMSRLDP